jgi:hypothetical protein
VTTFYTYPEPTPICAVAASILTAAWHMLRNGTLWRDLGSDHFHKRAGRAPVHVKPVAALIS